MFRRICLLWKKVVAELHGLYVDTERMLNDPKQGNSARLTICNNVADALKSAYSYRKDIPDSGDADPVEFFLKGRKKQTVEAIFLQ